MSHVADEVLAIERGFWTKADDPKYFEENVLDGGLSVIEPMGFVEKEQAIQYVADKPWEDVEMLDVHVREVADDCVIVAYHGRGRQAGGDKPYQGAIASTYVRRDGRWQLALTAHQPWTPKS